MDNQKGILCKVSGFIRRTEFKKIGFVLILLYSVAYMTVGRICEIYGIYIDTSTDVALVYTVCGSFVSYCLASASDKISKNHAGQIFTSFVSEKTDGTE